jgi:hypothetical protein
MTLALLIYTQTSLTMTKIGNLQTDPTSYTYSVRNKGNLAGLSS